MASPMVDGRVDPHRKATYTLDVSEHLRGEDSTGRSFSGVRYNHKPSLASTSDTRAARIQLADNNTYSLALHDTNKNNNNNTNDGDMFVFNGARTAPSKSYVLRFDQTTHKATLERLDSTYTFNLATKNGADVSSSYAKIYPPRSHKDSVHDREEGEVEVEVELFGDTRGDDTNDGTEPDASNPYDFRHFLHAVKTKKDTPDDHHGYASSPDARASAPGSANTSVPAARRAVEPAPKKRKAASLFAKKPTTKNTAASKKAPAPATSQDRSAQSAATQRKPAAAAAAAKIKSTEFVQSSDDSDVDADGAQHSSSSSSSSTSSPPASPGALEIHVPDARAPRRHPTHLAPHDNSSGGGGGGTRRLRSPSNGPISLASAATSVAGTPRQHVAADEIDFGDLDVDGDEDENEDEEEDDDDDGVDLDADADVDMDMDGGMDMDGDMDMDMDAPAPAHTHTRKPHTNPTSARVRAAPERKPPSGGGVSGSHTGNGNGNGSGNARSENPPATTSAATATAAAETAEVDEDELYMEMMEGLAGGDSSEESEEE